MWLLLLAGLLLGQSCGKHRPSHSGKGVLAEETDALGRSISVRHYPDRIVSMAPSNTEMLLSLGLRQKLVGVTSFYGFPEQVEGVAKIGGYTNPSVAKVVSLRPDLVFAARGNPREVIEQLRRRGIKVFTLDTRTVSGLLADIRKVGALTGCVEGARRVTREIENDIREIHRAVAALSDEEKPRVLWVGQEEPLRTAGRGSFVDELIRLAGGKNVAGDEERAWPAYNLEKVVLRDPEVIILSEDMYKRSPGTVAKTIARFNRHAAWGNISAVRKRRVHFIPADLLGQPSPAFVVGLKELARLLHPDVFPGRVGEKGEAETEKRSD